MREKQGESGEGLARAGPPADDVGIHAGSADVFAHLIHHQHIPPVEGNAGQPGFGDFQQPLFALEQAIRGHGLDDARLVVAVFHDPQTQQNAAALPDDLGHPGQHSIVAVAVVGAMIADGPPVLPQADGQHLGQAAFDLGVEVGVGLDAVDDGDVVRFQRVPVQHHRGPLRGLSNGKSLHGGPDGHAHGGLGDAVVLQHPALSFSRPAPVASHGGNDEGQRPPLFQLLRQAPDDGCDVGHAPAAGGDGHAVPRFQAAQVEPPHLPSHSGRNVRHLSRTETLPDPNHLGKSHGHSRKTAKDSRLGPQTAQKRRPIYHETGGRRRGASRRPARTMP